MASKRPPFITKSLSAYHHREVPNEDEYLTHTGPGTPAGEYLRRFWQPVAYSHYLNDLPLRVEVMGEELVLFRDGRGAIGLLELHCSHRGTSLGFGLIEEQGIRCCYHGWLFDVAGRILDTPLEPPNSTLKDRLCHGAYPVREYKGMVLAYMGPPDKVPEFPILDLYEQPGYTLEIARNEAGTQRPCNWLQSVDNLVDPLHEEILHARISGIQFINKEKQSLEELVIPGQAEFIETPTGIMTLDVRRVDECIWVRNIEYVWPNMATLGETLKFPPDFGPGQTEIHEVPNVITWAVPMNDTNTLRFSFISAPIDAPRQSTELRHPAALASNMAGRPYEEQQRMPGDYEAQVGQRAIARHALEHLGVEDRGVTMMRREMRKGIGLVERGQDPPGISRDPDKIIPTYGGDTVLRVPPAPTEEEDRKLVLRLGLEMAKRYVENPPHLTRSPA